MGEGIIPWLLPFALLFWKFPLSEFEQFTRTEVLLATVQLFFAALALASVGSALRELIAGTTQGVFWSLLVGQVGIGLWIYFRSGLNEICNSVFGAYLYLTDFELILLVLLACFVFWKRNQHRPLIFHSWPSILLLFVASWVVAQRELPRLSMLSSDPDLHVFWGAQLQRLGSIPANLGTWGPLSLGYPAGFSVLNFTWSALSQLDLQQIVSIQPVYQSLLAFLLLVSAAETLALQGVKSNSRQLFLGLAAIALYFLFLPYGQQKNFFHQEGTARTSSLFLLSGMALSTAYLFFELNIRKYWVALLGLCCSALVIGINPIHGLYALPCAAICGLYFFLPLLKERPIQLLLTVLPLLVLADPYFSSGLPIGPSRAHTSGPSAFDIFISGVLDSMSSPLSELAVTFSSYFSLDFYPLEFSQRIIFAIALVYLLLRVFQPNFRRVDILLAALPILVLIVLAFVVEGGLKPFNANPNLRLTFPYALHLSQQAILLWLTFLFLLVLCMLSRGIALVWVACLSIVVLGGLRTYRDQKADVRMEPRYTLQSGMGYPTPDDFIVISQIEQLYAQISSRHGELSAEETPKILIPNFLSDTGWEQWLFPYGGSRALPLHKVLPLAFYYNQGFPDFSYRNYREKICKSWDLQWLKDRNIRYFFVPSQRGPICVRGLERLLRESEVLFKQGNSTFLKLF